MKRIFQTICAIFPIVALAILLDAAFATQQVSAKPIPLPRSVAVSKGPNTGNLRSLRYVRTTPSVPETRDRKRARTKPTQPPTKPTSEAQTWTGESIVARERRPSNRASSKGQPSDPRDVQRSRSETLIVSRKGTIHAQDTHNSPRTSSFEKKTTTLKRQRRQLKSSAEKFHRLAAHPHLHNDSAARTRSSHALNKVYRHARAANHTFSQLAALNDTMNAAESGELEAIIGDIVNTVTQVLSEVTMLTGNIPIIGPELEGVASQIQSLLTNILDTAQGFLDNVLGILKPIDSVLPGIV